MTDTRAELKRIATERIQVAGVASASFRELGAAIGIKSSSVLYHFGNKDAMLEELVRDYVDGALASIERRTQKARDPRAKLACAIDEFESVLAGERACLCGVLAGEVEQLAEPARQELRRFFEEMEAWLEAVFVETGLSAKKARDRAGVFLASLQGALLIDRTMGAGPVRLSALRRSLRE